MAPSPPPDGAAAPTAAEASPYVGLSFFTEADAEWFFGRDSETHTIIANLRASRLTILYAESGVGKSSLLRAGVSRQLRELAAHRLARRGTPGYLPVVMSAWKDDPVADLIAAIEQSLQRLAPTASDTELPRQSLTDAIESATAASGARLLVVLDQFEEYFLYRTSESVEGRFADELAECINRPDIRANFLIAIREDAYAGLGDLFAGRLPNVYGNYIELQYLDRSAARETIVKPIEHFNDRYAPNPPVGIEPQLVEAVLDQVRTGEVVLASAGRGAVESGNGASPQREEIETPYLQLVMSTLWAHERANSSSTLRLTSLQELGGADEIVRTHLDGALASLPDEQQGVALDVFRYLVTPSGTKIVHAASDLAQLTERPADEVATVLARLAGSDTRILRHVPPPAGRTQPDDRYEIFHDVLAPSILDWRRRTQALREQAQSIRERERLETEKREAVETARRERRRARTFRGLAALLSVLLAVVIVWLVITSLNDARRAQRTALAEELTRQAATDLQVGSLSRGVLLSIEALRLAQNADTRGSITAALLATRGMGAYIRGHTAPVTGVAFNPAGTVVASGSGDGTVIVSSVATSRIVHRLPAGDQVSGVAFSQDGSMLAAASQRATGGAVTIWNARTGRAIRTIPWPATVENVAFSPNSKLLASAADDGTVAIWDALTGAHLRTLRGPSGPVYSVAFGRDSRIVAGGSDDHTVSLWDAADGRRLHVLRGHSATVNGVAFSRDGAMLASAGADHKVKLWSVATGQLLATLSGHSDVVESVAFSPDGQSLASGSDDHDVIVWGLKTLRQESVFRDPNGAILSVGFNRSGTALASGIDDGSVILWNVRRPLLAQAPAIAGVAFNPAGNVLAAASDDDRALLLDPRTGAFAQRPIALPTSGQAVAFDPTRRIVAVAAGAAVELTDLESGQRLNVLPAGSGYVYGVAFSPDGRLLATAGSDHYVRVWRLPSGKPLWALARHTDAVNAVAFAPRPGLLASASSDGTVILWNAFSGRRIRTLSADPSPVEGVAFSPNGDTIASAGDDRSITLWDVGSGQRLSRSLVGTQSTIYGLAYSPTGTGIASAQGDGTAMTWDLTSGIGEPVASHTQGVQSVAFSPSGSALASASLDGTVRLSPVPDSESPGAVTRQLCQIVRTNLSRATWRQFLAGQAYHETCPGWGS